MKKSLLGLLLLALACSEESAGPEAQQEPVIADVKLASRWNVNAATAQTVEVKVSDPQGPENLPETLSFDVRDENQNSIFSGLLNDDGGFNTSSGDVIAGDGVYRNRFAPSTISSREGTFTFEFSLADLDGNVTTAQSELIVFANNGSPELLQVDAPQSLGAGEQPLRITAKVSDPDGATDVNAVFMDLLRDNVSQLNAPFQLLDDGQAAVSGDLFAGDSVFTILVDSSFAAGRIGSYRLLFYAEDDFEARSNEISSAIDLQNSAGSILAVEVPESIDKPEQPGTFNQAFVTARVDDPQSLADVDSVYFFSRRPDGELANDGNPLTLVDNGLPFNINNPFQEAGDKVADDGTWSLTVLIDNSAQTGFFVFSFYMRDKAGHLSSVVRDSIEVR